MKKTRLKSFLNKKNAVKTAYGDIFSNLIPLKNQKAHDSCSLKHTLERNLNLYRKFKPC